MPAPTPLPTLAVRHLPAPAPAVPATSATPTAPATPAAAAPPPVVLLHGFASSADADFARWTDDLAAAGRDAYLVDLPGHGSSPAVTSREAALTASVVAAIAGRIAALGTGEVDVVGYSLGARLAWELPAATGRVRRLVLGGLSPFEPFAGVDVVAVARAVDGEPAADPFVGMMAEMVSGPGCDTDSLLALMGGLGEQPFDPGAEGAVRPEVPTLFVAGADDPMTTGLESLAAGVPDSRVLRVPGDHRGALESAEFRREALAFLAQ